jgi:transcriptional/translational regulatory protein YebC/TACO1
MEVPGVIDVTSEEGEVRESMIEVVSDRDLLHSVRQAIENKGYRVERAELTLIPKETVAIDEATAEKLEKLVTSLENSAEVVNVWHNAVVRKG